MKAEKRITQRRQRRRFRVRNRVRGSSFGRPRLSVFRSNKHMYAQVIDDEAGRTVVAASSREKTPSGSGPSGGNSRAAAEVGKLIAERALEQGIKQVVLDRGLYKYHGRVAALAEAARSAGLEF